MIKKTSVVLFVFLFLVGCASGSAQLDINDNGLPGQIKTIVFSDDNKNGNMDPGEPGFPDRVQISPENSCPPSNLENVTYADTDTNGDMTFKDLEPGPYCIAYAGSKSTTTKLAITVFLSSEQEAVVVFGVSD